MKLQASELPIAKPQTRRKTPKIGPLIVLTVLCTVIPIYYPSLRYFQKKLSQSSLYLDHVQDSIKPTAFLEPLSAKNDHVVPPKFDETKRGVEKPPKSRENDRQEIKSLEKDVNKVSDLITAKALDKDSKTGSSSREHDQATPEKSKRHKKKRDKNQQSAQVINQKEPDKTPRQDVPRALVTRVSDRKTCDIFTGEWVPNPEGPYYTNRTCSAIQEHQNCMKYGRPDMGFTKWRWKPDGCELPIFDPHQFLELVRGKSLAFVGDSVARNHMQSLICLLSRVLYPEDRSDNNMDVNFKKWFYPEYNFNISIFWAPYLVKNEKTDPNDVTRPFNLFLDEFDENWRTQIESFDYVIISAGQWFFRPTFFYLKQKLVGCLYCSQPNITNHVTAYFSYRRAFRTALKAINSLNNFKGITFLRTFAPSHFEGGPWDQGGDCVRTRPFKKNETVFKDLNLEMYTIQLQELKIAQREGRKKGMKLRLFDATKAMLLRPDGHPSKYGRWPSENVNQPSDCVHWCLPGPVDAWNDFLQELMLREVEDRSIA